MEPTTLQLPSSALDPRLQRPESLRRVERHARVELAQPRHPRYG
eukprot:CAMPEP_0198423394 /NCGR_PEP_ID=MMETSP1452-20131203/3080_1 /TAXON_ID=1181717 /ORGANISM="Synchroma pusillum, Strain CCMP3072" /LENGTH=43 /DNA_ID= /DNA_START= /DNA_END= /DNA_ORIENTATION=